MVGEEYMLCPKIRIVELFFINTLHVYKNIPYLCFIFALLLVACDKKSSPNTATIILDQSDIQPHDMIEADQYEMLIDSDVYLIQDSRLDLAVIEVVTDFVFWL